MSLEEAFGVFAEQVNRTMQRRPVEDFRNLLRWLPHLSLPITSTPPSFPPEFSYRYDGKLINMDKLRDLALLVEYIATCFAPSFAGKEYVSVVEPGCGVGTYSLMLAHAFPSWAVTGFDMLRPEIREAKQRQQDADRRNVHFEATTLARFRHRLGRYDLLTGYRLCIPFADQVLQQAAAYEVPNIVIVPCCTFRVLETYQDEAPAPLFSSSSATLFPPERLRKAYQALDMKARSAPDLPYWNYRLIASSFVLFDRALFLQEQGYTVHVQAVHKPLSDLPIDYAPVLIASKRNTHPTSAQTEQPVAPTSSQHQA